MKTKRTRGKPGFFDARLFRTIGCIFVIGGILPSVSIAAPLEYKFNVEVGATHTDNIFLANDGLEESELVYVVSPEFILKKESDRFTANLRYRPDGYFYDDQDSADNVFHALDANIASVLVRERLFLDLIAVNFQTIVSPEGVFPGNNLPITGNIRDSLVLSALPRWEQRLGQADLRVEAGYRDVRYDDSLIQSFNEKSGSFELSNVERQQGLAWGIEYNYRRAEYEIAPPWEFQRAGVNLGFWLNGTMRVFATGGAETSFDDIFEANLDEEYWEVGFQHTPSDRMNLELAVGERSYGTSFRGVFRYKLRRGNISMTYSEGPSTRGELVFERNATASTDNLDNLLDSPGASDRFVQKRGDLQASIKLNKSLLTLRVFAEDRGNRTTADGTPLEDESYSGAAVRWAWNLGSKTTFGAGINLGERDQSNARNDFSGGQIDFAYKLTQRGSVRIEMARTKQEGKDADTFDYTENQIRLFFRAEF